MTVTYPTAAFSKAPKDSLEVTLIRKNGLDEYQIDLEKSQPVTWKSLFARLKPRNTFNARRCCSNLCEWFLISLIFFIPNLCAATMIYFYVVGSVDPLSSVAAAIHHTGSSYLVYMIFLALVNIVAGLANLMILLAGVQFITKSFLLSIVAALVAFVPIWCPYVIEAALRKHLWDVECDGFDGTIFMDAVNYGQTGLSYVQFPESLGGQEYQIYESDQNTWEFAPAGGNAIISYNLVNETYTVLNSTTLEGGQLTGQSDPLVFPEFGETSEGTWIRSCFAPAVSLKNSTGSVVLQTGLTAYTSCAKMQVCAMKPANPDALLVPIGRILIALQAGASCCTRSRWG
jgi:hypothetical protein